jgi:transcriptional regulator with XRE-family HTH domain
VAEKESPNKLSREEINFAEQVRVLREEKGISQDELAELLRQQNLLYVNQATVSRIENKTRSVRLMEAQALSLIFGRTIVTMTNPDSREVYLLLAEASNKNARKSFVALKDAAADFARAQIGAEEKLASLNTMFGSGEELDPETRAHFDDLVENIENFTKIDPLVEAARVMAQVRDSSTKQPHG